jgi:RNA ligase
VIARPFPKFWNYEDPRHPETMPENLPAFLPEITVKQDGSLLIGFNYDGEIGFATRGSFASEQARWAHNWVKNNLPDLTWPAGWTPLWELIAPFNRIVVDYGGWEGIIGLALVNIETGEEAPRATLESWALGQGITVTPLVNKQLEICGREEIPNFEGYVATWRKTGESPLRAKIKLESYCALHRILTGLNPKAIWELLATNAQDAVYLWLKDEKMPVGFKKWLSGWVDRLQSQYAEIETRAKAVFAEKPEGTRKDVALYFQRTPALCSILFAMLDGKDFSTGIWGKIKPRGDETFKDDGE